MLKINFQAVFSLFLAAALQAETNSAKPVQAEDYKHPVRVACVGDSITFGSQIEGRETNSYPAVLGQFLGSKFVVKNFGVGGATLLKKGDKPYWGLSAFKKASDFGPDVVVIKLGTNDSKPQNWKHGEEFENDLRAMVEHFQQLPSKPRVWLCLPVPVYETRWGINNQVVQGQVIPRIEKVAKDKGLPVIDLYTALLGQPLLFPDKVHPNAAGARLMAQTIFTALTGQKLSL